MPSMRPNRNTMGIRNAKSVRDGTNRIATGEFFAVHRISRHPGLGPPHCKTLNGAQTGVQGAKIHVIHAQRHARKSLIRFRTPAAPFPEHACTSVQIRDSPGSSTSTVMICPSAGGGSGPFSPRQATSIPLRLMFSVYIAPRRPERRRTHMAPEFNFNSRALTPVDISHWACLTLANLALWDLLYQDRKWVIARCTPRLSAKGVNFFAQILLAFGSRKRRRADG